MINVNLRSAGDGMTRLTALLSAADAAAIMQSFTGAAHARPTSDARTIDQTRADLLTVTWLGRFAPTRLKQVLEFRDGTSVFPTSSEPARMCDTDHSDPWPADTNAANTGPVNRRAHNLKTEGLIDLRQPSPGTFEWTTRTGHTYTQTPDQLPIAGWDTGTEPV